MSLRIAYVLNVFPKLSETFVAGELAELARRGVDVRILSLDAPADEVRHDVVERAGLLPRTYYDETAFRTELDRWQPDLVHAHFALKATARARQLAGDLKLPFTFTAHGYDVHRTPPPDLPERAAAAAAVVTVSQANLRVLVERHGVPRQHLHVIPCGVDLERFTPGATGEALLPPVLLCVARLAPVKNHGLLLAACALLRERGVPFRCVLVGDGETLEDVEGLRRDLGLESSVELAGPLPQAEVMRWWRRAAVGVLVSTSEGMPVSLMEAAASGVPVVATRVGGVPELVEDGVTGLLVPSGDVEALATALERLLRDPDEAGRLGAAARLRAERRFSVSSQVDSLIHLWRSILIAPPDRRAPGRAREAAPVLDDPSLPTLALALDLARAEAELRRVPWLRQRHRTVELVSARVVRHKPKKRALLEYQLLADGRPLTLLGKIRARRFGNSGYRLLSALWNAGFSADSPDGISVPEPVGTVPGLQMWLQRKEPGRLSTELLSPTALELAARLAQALRKLHLAGVATEKSHTIEDELRILHQKLPEVSAQLPALAERVEKVLAACGRLGAQLPAPAVTGIHRDFFSDQVLVDGDRLVLLDFDLYCQGEPGLDAGNFLGHVSELALRTRGDAAALSPFEEALREHFAALEGEERLAAADGYALLTLVRHVYLSTLLPEGRAFTEPILALCEERLARRGVR